MRFRSLFVACVLPLAATVTAYGCSGGPTPEDLCGWLQNPNGTNCVAEFHEDIGNKCGASDPSLVSGTFSKREALDVCLLAKGGTVVFDPPIEIAKIIPTGGPTTMKITNGDGSACGEITHESTFTWSLKIAAPPPSMSTSSASSSATSGAGGAEEQGESHYSNGTISVTRAPASDTITVACPAPDVHAGDVLTTAETHTFNLNQSIAASQQNGCPQFAQIIPQASLEIDPGGVLHDGSVRLKILFPPEAQATGAGGGGATSSTGGGAAATVAPEVVFYFDCVIPGAPLLCANTLQDPGETDVDCGGPESAPNCPARCGVGQKCGAVGHAGDCNCDASSFCLPVGGVNQCVLDTSIPPKVKGTCDGIICSNMAKDASESDIDCGGVCSPCMDGKKCGENKDCISNSCINGVCGPPTCTDVAANGDETDIDCGGPLCKPCKETQKCKVNTDCDLGGCSPAGICSACFNKMKDGAETDADCGGPTCPKCGEGMICTMPSDCVTNSCAGGKCNGCSNGTKDGKETDKDCGGPICSKDPATQCKDGQVCLVATDCVDNGCLNGKCSACADGMQDNNESDVDCGYSGMPADPSKVACPKCDNGKVCVDAADCISGQCDGNKCGSCSDGMKDGNESDVDCGGFVCGKCPEGKVCNVDFDCALGICEYPMQGTSSSSGTGGGPVPGICNTCNNGFTDGTESDQDCGGLTCKKCVLGDICKVNTDCTSGICINKLCK